MHFSARKCAHPFPYRGTTAVASISTRAALMGFRDGIAGKLTPLNRPRRHYHNAAICHSKALQFTGFRLR